MGGWKAKIKDRNVVAAASAKREPGVNRVW
jgi:hypothetical protein